MRKRPPGHVTLTHGQREHVLYASFGRPFEDAPTRSVLTTEFGRREWQSCPAGHVTFVPAGLAMDWMWNYTSESVHLTLSPELLDGIAAEAGLHDPTALKPLLRVVDPTLAGLLHRLRDEAVSDALGKDLMTSSLLTMIGTQLLRTTQSPPTGASPNAESRASDVDMQRCITLMRDRLSDNISLTELAETFGLSPFHFSRVFKLATGYPPHEFQLRLRIEKARDLLLARPRKTVAEIAVTLGFADESHFRRHFRRLVGTTPGRFRAQQ
ncbi:MAG: AraC family transcriptional regulator [Pseudomonadota bacterium]